MILFHAEKNVTKRYNADAWHEPHTDKWEDLNFTIKCVFGKQTWESDEYDAGYNRWVYARTNKPVSQEDISEAVWAYFHRSCSCEHDCCGHYFGGAGNVTRANRNGTKWKFCIHYAPNY